MVFVWLVFYSLKRPNLFVFFGENPHSLVYNNTYGILYFYIEEEYWNN